LNLAVKKRKIACNNAVGYYPKKKSLRGNGGALTIACYMKILNNFVVKVDF
jgi:hypothetical protein